MSKLKNTKKITVWINTSWDCQGYKSEIDTGIPLWEWEGISDDDKEDICNDLAKDEFLNAVEYGYYE